MRKLHLHRRHVHGTVLNKGIIMSLAKLGCVLTSRWRPEHGSRHSDLLLAGRSGNRIPVGRDFPCPSTPAPTTTQFPVQMMSGILPGGKVAGLWC